MSAKLRDPLRFGLQSAAGAVFAYFVARAIGLSELSWAVMSALFVAHLNLDATFSAAVGRIGGTLLGSLLGLAAVLLLPGTDEVGWRLAAVALAMNAVAVVLPNTQFGVVAAAVIVLPSGEDVWAGALERGSAIAVGTLVGTACAFLVWPESAARRARRVALRALAACRDVFAVETGALMGLEEAATSDLHRRVLATIRDARDLADGARLWGTGSRATRALIDASSRLWHTLLILNRLQADHKRREQVARNGALAEQMQAVREQVGAMLAGAGPGQRTEVEPALEALRSAIGIIRTDIERHDLEPLAFMLEELICDLEELDRALAAC